ncbi:MAG: glycoside hydrolase family 3 N-terminal domain-containing protein, partial [Pseudomonadota bacterium]
IAMTAHIIYTALDPINPITISKKAIDYLRNELEFKGLIISDDINMKALKGSLSSLTKEIFNAGCDLVLHCNGNLEEIKEVLRSLTEASLQQ